MTFEKAFSLEEERSDHSMREKRSTENDRKWLPSMREITFAGFIRELFRQALMFESMNA
jgi:hypothetical protein